MVILVVLLWERREGSKVNTPWIMINFLILNKNRSRRLVVYAKNPHTLYSWKRLSYLSTVLNAVTHRGLTSNRQQEWCLCSDLYKCTSPWNLHITKSITALNRDLYASVIDLWLILQSSTDSLCFISQYYVRDLHQSVIQFLIISQVRVWFEGSHKYQYLW